MKNANMPAMPSDIDAQTFGDIFSSDFRELTKYRSGLTKREMVAMCAMQGLVSSGSYDKFAYLATDAVNIADALLAELEMTKDKR